MYKIYKYTNNINKKIYIGLTSQELSKRAGSNGIGYKLCTNFYEDILKFGFNKFDVEILEDNIEDLQSANNREIFYINKFNSNDPLIGYNIQPGGSKFIMNESIKKIIGERVKSSKKFIKNNFEAHHKKIIGINIIDGSILKFDSITAGATALNISRGSLGCCCNGYKNNKVFHGYYWLFEKDFDPSIDYLKKYKLHRSTVTYGKDRNKKISLSQIKRIKNDNSCFINIKKPVIRIDKNNNEKEYSSLKEAALENNIKMPSNISLVCNNKRKSAGNFKWRWK